MTMQLHITHETCYDYAPGVSIAQHMAYLKPMNTKLEDGTPVKCKRRGLKIVLSVGSKKGEGLMRRLDVGLDPIVRLDAALQEAAKAAAVELTVENGVMLITP